MRLEPLYVFQIVSTFPFSAFRWKKKNSVTAEILVHYTYEL